MAAVNNKFALIIDTVPYVHDVNPYMPSLSLNGTLVLVGFSGNLDEPALNTVPLVMIRKSVAGSALAASLKPKNYLIFVGNMASFQYRGNQNSGCQ